jgi:hypothetical protein
MMAMPCNAIIRPEAPHEAHIKHSPGEDSSMEIDT